MPKLQENIKKLPTAFVILGATGDLAKKRIFPALYKLSKNSLLPQTFKVIATARTSHSNQDFKKLVKEMLELQKIKISENEWQNFASKLEYISADVEKNINLESISKSLESFELESKVCIKRIFYMSVSPTIYEDGLKNLGTNELHLGCKIHSNKPSIIIEKPFGSSLQSARHLRNIIESYFTEDQIYRIDHYLGKETIQNIFAFRFDNEIFEPTWNNKYIDHVQITVGERIGVEKRGEFYDKTGALKDMVQNHLLQQMTMVTMEEPEKFEAKSIQAKKLEILKSIKKMPAEEIVGSTIRGQYKGYLQEEKINPNSQTESFAQVKLYIDTPRWKGVPFYLRTGKKLPGKVTSIIIQYKEKKHKFFENLQARPIPNHITIQVQPNEGIGLRLVAKKPGLTTVLEPVDMEFCYKSSFDSPQPEAYERLLLDVILGDQSLFISQAEVEASWEVIDPIRKVWDEGKPPLVIYEPDTWGPREADNLMEKDGKRTWLAPLLTICKI